MITHPQQQAAILHPHDISLCIEAGPGSGKTHVLSQRAARFVRDGVFKASQIAMMTYTRSMASDLRDRVGSALPEDLDCRPCGGVGLVDGAVCSACAGTGRESASGLAVGTMHSLAARWVKLSLEGEIGGGDALRATGLVSDEIPIAFALPEDVDDLLVVSENVARIGKRKLRGGLKLRGAELNGRPREAELRYQLRGRGLITYDDALALLEVLVGSIDFNEICPCLMLDERQDLSGAHWRIVDAWKPRSLTAVGDSAQAIFGFLGERGSVRSWGRVANIGVNFRSVPEIVSVTSRVRAALVFEAACQRLDMEAQRPTQGVVWLRRPWDAVADTVECVCSFVDAGHALEDVAVLATTWAELNEIAAELEKIGIDVDIPNDTSGHRMWSTVPGRAIVGAARIAARGFADDLDVQLICRVAGLSYRDALTRAYRDEISVMEALRPLGIEWDTPSTMGQIVDIVQPHTSMDLSVVPREMKPEEWLAWMAGDEFKNTAPAEGVALRTVHGAKGLEWPVVVAHNACQGQYPARWTRDEEEELEWGRALYVAVTRARDALVISAPRELRGRERQPARWLRGLKWDL